MKLKSIERSLWLSTLVVILLPCAGVQAILPPTQTALANFDRRTDGRTNEAPSDAVQAAEKQLKTELPRAEVSFDPVSRAPKYISADGEFLTGAGGRGKTVTAGTAARYVGADPDGPTKAFVQEHRELFGHGPEALDRKLIKREFVTEHSGMRTVVWEQKVDGIPLFEATFISHTTRNGELVNVSSQFVPDPVAAADLGVPNRAAVLAAPNISARQATVLAAKNIEVELDEDALVPEPGDEAAGVEKKQLFHSAKLKGNAEAKLIWLPMDQTRLRLCWDVIVTSGARGEMFRVLVDAQTGEVQVRRCLTAYLSNATYRVYTSDSPSPNSPTYSTPTTTQPPLTSRSLITLSALDTNASPNGWINDGGNETWGNNVDAHTDINANDVADLPRPQGLPSRVFDFSMDLAQAPNTYSSAAVVQLFYWNNFMHDKLYQLGFTEAAGNFQSNNFARGGVGGDAVQADAQDGSGFNNANFSTPPDGSAGRMQMYLFSGPTPDRDGDFDAEVVLHEYTHGLSNRRVGGGVGISALQTGGMGEGWSDFYALCLLSEASDNVNGTYAAGGYATYLFNGLTTNYYYGIRRYPYCTDMTKNPLTFKDIDPAQASAHVGIPRSPVIPTTANEVHNMGEVWCMTLREAWAKLVTKHGWATGNQLVLQLVTDGMNLSPANPNFLQARNAILQADLVNNGGANQSEIWAAFAKRGMGYTATSPASSTTTGVHEAFDVPDNLTILPMPGVVANGPVGGPFSPNVMSFALTNLGTTNLNWSLVSTSVWFSVSPTSGTLTAGGVGTSVNVTVLPAANSLPSGSYAATINFTNTTTGVGQSRTVTLNVVGSGMADDFDPGIDLSQWASFGGTVGSTVIATNFGGFVSSPNSLWFGDEGTRHATTIAINTGGGGAISFALRLGSGTYPWENVDVPSEGIVFEASTNNSASWNLLGTYNTTNYQAWTTVTSTIPVAARSSATQFRWRQLAHSGSSFDHWALDNVVIDAKPATFLTLTVPTEVSEGDTSWGGFVTASPVPTNNLTVTLNSSDTSEITVPATVTILAGQSNAVFLLTVQDDPDLDGSQTAQVTAAAAGYTSAASFITVLDDESATLSLSVPASVTEGGGSYLSRVDASAAPTTNITVALTSSDPTEILVPATVVMPAGQTSAVFSVTVVDDTQIDGTQTATVTAQVLNWGDGTAVITVLDNETTNLTLTLPANVAENAGVLTGAGSVRLSGTLTNSLLVSLVSGSPGRLGVPSTVTIAAGQLSNTFNLTAVDNNLQDGNQIASVIASAPGFLNGTNSAVVVDDDIPPSIVAQPTNLSIIVGQTAHFSVVAVGKTPLSYQWKFNGTDISDATNATFTLPNAQFGDAGTYAVTVTNIYGHVDSSNAILTVTPPVCAPPASGILAWWRGDGDAGDNVGNSPGTVVGTVGYDTGEVGQSFSFNGSSGYVSIPDSALLDSISNRFTVEVWFRNNVVGNNGDWAGIVCKGNTAWRLQATAFADTVTFSATGASSDLIGTRSVNDGQWHHAAGVYDGTNIFLYIDGTLDGSHASSGSIAQNNYPVAIGANANPPGVVYYFNGSVDEASIYNRALSASEIEAIYFAGGLGKCFTPTPPVITTQPASRTNVAGTVATFSVTASGTSPLSYQWTFNGTGITDETNATLTLPNVQPGQAGTYAVTVSNPGGVTNSVDAILTVIIPPPATITTQPVSRTNVAGTVATFSMTATGAPPLSYQWTFNGGSITDATNTTLTISNVQPIHAGAYAVLVSNPGGVTNSVDAILTVVLPPPPTITAQPVSRTNFVGSTASFSVTAMGTPPLSYQWTFNGTPITDATNTTLTLPNVDVFQSGNYAVTVTNYGGATNSVNAILTVTPVTCVPPPSGLVSWWRGEGDSSDVLGVSSGTPVGSVAYNAGTVGQGFSFNGSGSYVSIPDSPLFNSLTNRITVEFWFQNNVIGNNGDWAGIVCKGNFAWRMQATAFANTITFSATGTSSDVVGTRNVNDGQWHHAAGVYDGTNIFLYIDGTLDISHPSTGRIATDSYPVAIGANANPPSGAIYFFNGSVDEVAIYNRALSASDVEAIYLAGSLGKCYAPVPPTITTQPTSRTNAVGTQAAFTVAATGTAPLNYQWTFNGTNINNETNTTLTLNNVQFSQAGNYAVTVSNPGGSTNSATAVLTVTGFPPPTITTQPVSRTNIVGTLATFTVAATGTGPLSYQWTFNGTNLNGATNTTLSLTNVQLNQSGGYAALVSNPAGTTNSASALLLVIAQDCLPPASGMMAWWRGEGNASDVLGTSPGSVVGSVTYRAGEVGQGFSFSNSSGYVSIPDSALLDSISNRFTLEVWFKNNNTGNNGDWAGIVCKGNTAWRLQATAFAKTVTFSATGTSADVVGTRNVNDGQWHHAAGVYNGTNIFLYVDGTLDTALPSTGSIAQNNYPVAIGANANPPGVVYYFNGMVDEVSIYNRALSSNEIAAIYLAGSFGKCAPTPPAITVQPTGRTNVGGTLATFDVTATGTAPLTYIWQKNATPIGSPSTNSLALGNVTRTNSGTYRVVVTNALGSATSSNAILLVRVPQRLGTPVRLGDGTFTFLSSDGDGGTISAGDLSRFEAQASTNLINWTTLPGALTLTNGSLRFNDLSSNAPMRFYRIIEN